MNTSPSATAKPSAAQRDGQALTELAIVLPLLIILVLGAVDFGRLFYAFQSVESAAAAGAQFACLSAANAANTILIQSNALAQAVDITNLHPVVTSSVVGSNVTVSVSANFRTMIAWPLMPTNVALNRTVNMRILQRGLRLSSGIGGTRNFQGGVLPNSSLRLARIFPPCSRTRQRSGTVPKAERWRVRLQTRNN